jgi:hypothetical protein
MGTRDKPIMIQLLCKDILYSKSWFTLNSSGLDLGFAFGYHINLESPWLGPHACRIKAYANANFDFGVETVVDWKPEFGIEEAQISMDMSAAIGVKYDTWLGGGHVDFASVALGGSLDFKTIPTTHVKGTLYGKVSVCDIGIGLDMGIDRDL